MRHTSSKSIGNYGLLFAAASKNQVNLLKKLAKTGLDINHGNSYSETPIMIAAKNGCLESLKFLIDLGARIDAVNIEDETVLFYACMNSSNCEVLEYLLLKGADINHKNRLGRTCLMELAALGYFENVTALLKYSPDIEAFTHEEESALTFAIVWDHIKIVEALIDAGANSNRADKSGWTPLTYAVYEGKRDIVRLLLEKGADPNKTDNNGETILMYAVNSKDEFSVFEIARKVSNINQANKQNKTALDYAKEKGDERIIDILIQLGAT
ncbi:MAG: ankyrin repeat domain-containing protein [bacterium]